MRVAKFLMAAAVATMAVAPAMAAPASSLSVTKSVRAGTPTTKDNGIFGAGIVAIVAAAAIVAGIIVVADNDDDADSN